MRANARRVGPVDTHGAIRTTTALHFSECRRRRKVNRVENVRIILEGSGRGQRRQVRGRRQRLLRGTAEAHGRVTAGHGQGSFAAGHGARRHRTTTADGTTGLVAVAAEARGSTGRRRHGTTGDGLGEGLAANNEVALVGVEDGALHVLLAVIFMLLVVTAASGLGLRVVKVLLVERPDPVGTLLGVLGRVIRRQRTQAHRDTAGLRSLDSQTLRRGTGSLGHIAHGHAVCGGVTRRRWGDSDTITIVA